MTRLRISSPLMGERYARLVPDYTAVERRIRGERP